MSEESPLSWPLSPSHSASVAYALCMALADLIHEEGGGEVSRRAFLQACGLATAAEVFSREAARWYGTRMGKDHDLLEALQARYMEEQ